MQRSSDRAHVEPFAALAAVLAVSAGLVVYAESVEQTLPDRQSRETARITLERVHDSLGETGVVNPAGLAEAAAVSPRRWQANVTLRHGNELWSTGKSPPPASATLTATRRVSIRTAPGQVVPATLRVVLWQ